MTNQIIVYSFDKASGEYLGETTAQKDPLDTSSYLVPAGATKIKPTLQDGYITSWNGESWINEEILPDPIPVKTLDKLKDERKQYLSKLVSTEMVKPLFCKTIDNEDCYISQDKTNKFLGYFALSDSSSVFRYFRAVSKEGARLSHDLKLNKTELKELALHYEQREDQLEEIENKYIDLIDAAKSKTALNNIKFEELE